MGEEMKNRLRLWALALLFLDISGTDSWAAGGSSFSACVAEGEVTYASATVTTVSATAGCLGPAPFGIAASLGSSEAFFPELSIVEPKRPWPPSPICREALLVMIAGE